MAQTPLMNLVATECVSDHMGLQLGSLVVSSGVHVVLTHLPGFYLLQNLWFETFVGGGVIRNLYMPPSLEMAF